MGIIKLLQLVLLAIACLYTAIVIAQTSVTITVPNGARQTFQGFGTSQVDFAYTNAYQQLQQNQRDVLTKLVWGDAHFKILRLWFDTKISFLSSGQLVVPSNFSAGYINSGIITDALQAGASTLLLAPHGLPVYMDDGNGQLSDAYVTAYTTQLASAIKKIKDDYNIIINASGVMNEPNNTIKKSQWASIIKNFRTALDSRGLQNVKIIAPENANCDGGAYQTFDSIKNDVTAWNSLGAFSTHSYNMAADDNMVNRIKGTGKEYWITEASANGSEISGDAKAAASLASRVLNDFNHYVTHWIWFIGYATADPKDDQTRLIRYWNNPFKYEILQPYYYIKQLSQTFDVGSVLRDATSSLEGDMLWTYGSRPQLTASCGKNPDGSWGIGLSNYTANDFTNSFYAMWAHTPAETFNATIKINELASSGNIVMNIYRSNSNINIQSMGTIVMNNGVVTVNNISSLDLITLRSVSTTTNLVSEDKNYSILVYPNPFIINFTLKFSSEIVIKNTKMKIYDVSGREVKTISIASNETIINRDELQNGIYFYSIINNNKKIANGKLVVQD
ncbi:MAG: T9SS type A sorting domain-containing protein [Bacteroidetes bacterium]|nr:T9SS type A sorting domain-containing protein [Bacteroidota bacterium]